MHHALTLNPACTTSCALMMCENPLVDKNRSRASTLNMCAVPRLLLTANPSLANSSSATSSDICFCLLILEENIKMYSVNINVFLLT